ncbi:unnamed protein product [Victoria cruziana]
MLLKGWSTFTTDVGLPSSIEM